MTRPDDDCTDVIAHRRTYPPHIGTTPGRRTRTRSRWWSLGIATLALVTGCGVVPAWGSSRPCPAGWEAAVVWSSQNGWGSDLSFVEDAEVVERRRIDYLGFEPGPGTVEQRSGADVVMVSNGNLHRDKTQLVTFSTETCDVDGQEVPEQLLLGMAVQDGFTFATSTGLEGAHVARRDPAGQVVAEATFAQLILDKLLVDGDTLYAFGSDLKTHRTTLLVLDSETLAERDRATLKGTTGGAARALIKDGKLYYPQTTNGEREGTELGVIDLATYQQTTVDLGSPAPFLLADAGDQLYIGHTYINPSFRPMTDYRWISRYDPATGKVERFDVGMGITGMEVRDQTLYVLGTTDEEDEDRATLRVFDLPGVTLRSETELSRPVGPGHYYPSSLIVS